MNREQLIAMVADYTTRADLTQQIGDYFIPLAEARIGRDLKSLENEAFTTVSVVDDSGADLPADYGSPLAAHLVGRRIPLAAASLDSIEKYRRLSGNPMFYYIGASRSTPGAKALFLAPGTGDVELTYYAQPKLEPGGTNPVLERYPQLYLYATSLELRVYEQNPDALSLIQGTYGEEINGINRDASRSRGAKSAMEIV